MTTRQTAHADKTFAVRSPFTRARAHVGVLTVATGLLHTVIGVVYYADELRAFAEAGIFGAVTEGTTGEIAFWFLITGVLLILVGIMARDMQRRSIALPGVFGWTLLGLGCAGAAMMPVSGFWLVIGLGVLAIAAARH